MCAFSPNPSERVFIQLLYPYEMGPIECMRVDGSPCDVLSVAPLSVEITNISILSKLETEVSEEGYLMIEAKSVIIHDRFNQNLLLENQTVALWREG